MQPPALLPCLERGPVVATITVNNRVAKAGGAPFVADIAVYNKTKTAIDEQLKLGQITVELAKSEAERDGEQWTQVSLLLIQSRSLNHMIGRTSRCTKGK